ncbi:Gfo/Idh/MocA family protein [Streptomyces sp. NPDC058463]|uniref:Gfo/Idh/MocA family protein n=1 Tax=Streptomyces sp. NPDC058463 TaxID=3346510 RepID=UPI0036611A35
MTASGERERPVRVALVGLGWAGRSIFWPRLDKHPLYEVTAVVEPDRSIRDRFAGDGSPRVLVHDADLDPATTDLAVVAVPNHLHAPVATRLLHRGIPVFLEKPVCLSVAEADQLAEAERAGGGVLLAGSAAKYRNDVRALHDLAAGLGPIRHIDVAWVRAGGVPDAGGWFTSRRLSGGGALVDLGWHLLDTVGSLLGPVDFEQVVGTVSDDFVNSGSRRASWRRDGEESTEAPGTAPAPGDEGDVEDTARGFLVTDGGVSVALRASWASHEARDITRITVEGRAGTATLTCTFGFSPNRQGSVLTRTGDGVTVEVPLASEPIGAEYARQLDDLRDRLTDPRSRGAGVAQARQTIGVIEQLYASARTAGQRRPLPAGHGAH